MFLPVAGGVMYHQGAAAGAAVRIYDDRGRMWRHNTSAFVDAETADAAAFAAATPSAAASSVSGAYRPVRFLLPTALPSGEYTVAVMSGDTSQATVLHAERVRWDAADLVAVPRGAEALLQGVLAPSKVAGEIAVEGHRGGVLYAMLFRRDASLVWDQVQGEWASSTESTWDADWAVELSSGSAARRSGFASAVLGDVIVTAVVRLRRGDSPRPSDPVVAVGAGRARSGGLAWVEEPIAGQLAEVSATGTVGAALAALDGSLRRPNFVNAEAAAAFTSVLFDRKDGLTTGTKLRLRPGDTGVLCAADFRRLLHPFAVRSLEDLEAAPTSSNPAAVAVLSAAGDFGVAGALAKFRVSCPAQATVGAEATLTLRVTLAPGQTLLVAVPFVVA